jgi:hypothetical protein
MNKCNTFAMLCFSGMIQQVWGHGAVTRPLPRKVSGQTYCPWCVGEHHAISNPSGQINHSTIPSTPCLGSSRGDERYSRMNFGGYGSIAEEGPSTYTLGESFEATIVLDADHNGDAQWQLCPHSHEETEECFRQRPTSEWVDVHAFWDPDNQIDHWQSGNHFPQNVTLRGIAAGPATLRWLWVCKYTDEIFVSCIDIDVVSGEPTPAPPPTPVPVGPAPTPAPAPTPELGPCSPMWGQCGGMGWAGPTCCDAGSGCVVSNPWYSQCLGAPEPPEPTSEPEPTLEPEPTPEPEPEPTPSPTRVPEPSCPWDAQMTACASQGGVFECKRCAEEITGNPCCSCRNGSATPSTHSVTVTSTTDTVTRATDTSSSTTGMTVTTTATGTAAAVTGHCKPWCGGNSKPWSKKCTWSGCSVCSECLQRRLRGVAFFP